MNIERPQGVRARAIADARQRPQQRVAGLDIECRADELGFWRRAVRGR